MISALINWLVIQRELMGLTYLTVIRKNDRRNGGRKIYNNLFSTQS